MANLKNLLVNGPSRFIGDTAINGILNVQKIKLNNINESPYCNIIGNGTGIYFSIDGTWAANKGNVCLEANTLRPSGASSNTLMLGQSGSEWAGLYTKKLQVPTSGIITASLPINITSAPNIQSNDGATGGLIIGTISGQNIGIDSNEIMARNSSGASTLYLNNEGGAVQIGNGGLILKAESTTSTNTPAKINFQVKDTTTDQDYAGAYISVYQDHGSPSNGANMIIHPGGNLVLGGGEGAGNLYTTLLKSSTSENIYLAADNAIYLYANCQTQSTNNPSNRVGIKIDTSGNVVPQKVENVNNSVQNLGASTNKWNSLYVSQVYIGSQDSYGSTTQPIYWNNGVPTAITGALANSITGNAATASTTKALKTADITTGSNITSHADVIQQYFSANYSSVPRKSLLSFYSDKKNPGSQYFGYYIDNYNTNPHGSFFAMHYNDDPVYIGISNGTYTERALLTDQYAYFDSSGNFIPRSVTNLGSTSNKWDILYARQAKIGDYLTIGASGSGNNAKTISSSDNLYLKSDSSSIIFQGNSASIAQFDSSATYAFRPNLDKGHSLGTSSYRWNNLYINTIHFGGSSYDNYITSDGSTNIYFNIQGNNSLVLEKNDIRPGTNKNISLGTLTNRWNKIYAKTYYPSYTWTIQSTHNSESLPFTLATTNDGEGANVPSGFYLIMVSVIYKPLNQTSFSFLCGGGIIPWINGIEEDFASYNFEQVIQSFGSATAQSLKLNLNGSEGYTRIRIHNSAGNAAIKIEKGKAQVYFLRIGDLKPE